MTFLTVHTLDSRLNTYKREMAPVLQHLAKNAVIVNGLTEHMAIKNKVMDRLLHPCCTLNTP